MIPRLIRSALTFAAVVAMTAQGFAQSYGQKLVQIKSGVLIVPGQTNSGTPRNEAPFVFFNLNKDRLVRPGSWQFVNPRSGGAVTAEMYQRWTSLGEFPPVEGTRITQGQAGYWEVPLGSVGSQVLADYDLLLMPVYGNLSLNPPEREKLRRFVDKGGTLWIDLVDRATSNPQHDIYNPAVLPFTVGNNSGSLTVAGDHPLLNEPNAITYDELAFLFHTSSRTIAAAPILNPFDSQAWVYSDSLKLSDVVSVGVTDKVVSIAQIGEGFVVVTSRGLSTILNRGVDQTGATVDNLKFTAFKPLRDSLFYSSAKLAYNIASLGSSFGATGRGSRKTSGSPVDIAAPLLRRFVTEDLKPMEGTTVVIYGGRAVMVTQAGVICYDTDPSRDLDEDGSTDDGLIDAPGSTVDVLWRAQRGSSKVSPVVLPAQRVGGEDLVLITQADGSIRSYVLAPNVSQSMLNDLPSFKNVPAPQSGATNPFPPTIHSGIAIMVAEDPVQPGSGKSWAFDPATLDLITFDRPFMLEHPSQFSAPRAGATVGFIPIFDSSNGVDLVAYVPTKKSQSPRNLPAGMSSLWLGARGESPQNVFQPANSGDVTLTTRAASLSIPLVDTKAASSSLGVKVSFFDTASGRPLSPSAVLAENINVNWAGQNGVIFFRVQPGIRFTPTQTEPANTAVRVDYFVNWGAPSAGIGAANADQFVRTFVTFPDTINPKREVIGQVALAPSGTVFVVTSPDGSNTDDYGGSVMAFREEGRGVLKMLFRWELFDDVEYRVNGSTTIKYGPSVIDQDGLLDLQFNGNTTIGDLFLDRPIDFARFVSGPVVRGNNVFVMARASKPIFGADAVRKIPANQFVSVLLAFDADPKPAELFLNNIPPNFQISQPDMARKDGTTVPTSFLQSNNYTYEIPPGSTTNSGRLRIDSMASTTRGQISQSIAINQPIIVRVPGQSEILIEPEMTQDPNGQYVPGNASGRWSPLRWYSVFNGTGIGPIGSVSEGDANFNPMVAAGETLYFGGRSMLPGLLNEGFAGFSKPPQALLYGVDVNIAASDLLSPTRVRRWMAKARIHARPWQRCLSSMTFNPSPINPVIPSTNIRWPQFFGVRTFDDLKIRINQAAMREENVRGMTAGDGTLQVWGDGTSNAGGFNSVNGYRRADFLVADEGRISRIDGAGNPLWATESTRQTGGEVAQSQTALVTELQSPWRVYPVGNGGYMIVDPGSDRVIRVDNSGNEIRSLKNIQIDPRYVPDGMSDNAPLTLRLPRDVVTKTSIVAAANNPFSNPQPYEYWRHYVVADQGNKRVLEVVDRYVYNQANKRIGDIVSFKSSENGTTFVKALGVVLWHVKSEFAGKQYSYNSIGRATIASGTSQKTIFAFGFGNVEPGRSSTGLDSALITSGELSDTASGGGGIILFDPVKGTYQVINSYEVGASPAGVFFDKSARSFDANNQTNPARPAKRQRIRGLTSVTMSVDPSGAPLIMFTDNTGVYELENTTGKSDGWRVRWMLPTEAYVVMRRSLTNQNNISSENPQGFKPSYARRLDANEVVVCNAYAGQTAGDPFANPQPIPPRPFTGEVLLVDGTFDTSGSSDLISDTTGFRWNKINLGFNVKSIRFTLPPLLGMRGLSVPVFADRR